MKIEVRKDAQNTWLALSGRCCYQPDYQVEMMKQVKPKGLLALRFTETAGETTFLYNISDMVSLQKYYRQNKLDDKEMIWIAEEIIVMIDQMRRYLLDPDRLILNPSCIFRCGTELFCCYLPVYRKPFRESFHILTEYFVRELDYDNSYAIQMGCRLHKYTMEENYDVRRVVQQVKKEVQEEKWAMQTKTGSMSEQHIIPAESVEQVENNSDKENKRSIFYKKKRKMSKWGEWENL